VYNRSSRASPRVDPPLSSTDDMATYSRISSIELARIALAIGGTRVVNERSKQAELANGMDSQSKSKPMPRFSALGSITPLDVRIIVRL